MRTEGKKKAGFYPTPLEVVELTSHLIRRPFQGERFRLLDPCCGEGEALHVLGERLGVKETYGIELDSARAKSAAKVLKQVLAGSFESMRSNWNAFSLLYLNPPYDVDEETKRLEHQFLTKLTPYLQSGGILIFVIVQKNLIKETARFLSSHFENIKVFRFPDPHFERFHQIILTGAKRFSKTRDPRLETTLNRYRESSPDKLPILGACEKELYDLVEPSPNFAFYSEDINPEASLEELRAKGLYRDACVRDTFFPRALPQLHPLMPLRKGHLAMLISAGYLNNTLLERNGRKLLIKGKCVKEQVKHTVEERETVTVIERDVIKTTIKGLDLKTGELITIQ